MIGTNPQSSSSSSCSGRSPLLAWCEDHRHCVRRRPAAPPLPDGVQHRQRVLLHRPGSAVSHHLLQDIQRHPAGHPEVRWRTPIQVSQRVQCWCCRMRISPTLCQRHDLQTRLCWVEVFIMSKLLLILMFGRGLGPLLKIHLFLKSSSPVGLGFNPLYNLWVLSTT